MAQLLSDRDAARLQDMLRWYDNHVDIRYQRRRLHGRGGGGGTTLHKAYAKAAAGAAGYIVCYLDSDSHVAADEVTVYCEVAGGTNLNAAFPLLADGDMITVWQDGDTWRNAGNPFIASQDC